MNRALIIAIALAASVAVAALSGCDFGDVIRVKTPRNVQRTETLPPTLTLNEARDEYEDWVHSTRNDSMRWRTSIERSDEINDLLGQFVLQGLDDIGPQVAGVPVLGPALPLITGLAGVLFPRPGERKRIEAATREAKETEHKSTWDEAFAAGRAAVIDGLREAKSV